MKPIDVDEEFVEIDVEELIVDEVSIIDDEDVEEDIESLKA
jgi:hypothetical protein